MLRGKCMGAAQIAHLINITVMLATHLQMAQEAKMPKQMVDKTV